jgi:hypothetical protein
MLCALPDWAFYLLCIGGLAAHVFSRQRLIERVEERTRRQIAELNAWDRMTPEERADSLIYGDHDVRPERRKRPDVKET